MHSVLLARWTNGPRMKRALPAHAARMQRGLDAQPANDSGQMTVPIKSDGVSCLSSYRSREETRHTIDIQNANQERKCYVSEFEEEDPAVAGGRGHGGRGRGGRGRSKELSILDHAAVGEDVVNTHTLSILIPSGLPFTPTLWVRRKSYRPNAGIAGIDRFQKKKRQEGQEACR